jgi:SAM-dependent methyltransferase
MEKTAPHADARHELADHLRLLRSPGCGAGLAFRDDALACSGCGYRFELADGIPLLFWPNEWDASSGDVTDAVKRFYEETPFPDYDDFDSVGSLIQKARQGMFAKRLDDQVPPGTSILECGCGTGQLTNFLSIANRTVFGTDICLNSLKLGRAFKIQNRLDRAHFLQMNLFRPIFKPESFDLVISNGVLHHTSDPFRAFQSIARLVKPNGYILIGLYHRYGRLVTDLRRQLFRVTRDRLTFLDPNLRRSGFGTAKRRAWFMDQYKHPHESKHTIGEVLGWLRQTGFRFVSSVPRSKPFQSEAAGESLFRPERPGNALERLVVELGMIARGSREGGFFVVTARRDPNAQKSV